MSQGALYHEPRPACKGFLAFFCAESASKMLRIRCTPFVEYTLFWCPFGRYFRVNIFQFVMHLSLLFHKSVPGVFTKRQDVI